jgi:hypothetical protein
MNKTPQLRHHALNAMKVLDVIDEGQMSDGVDEIVHRMITPGWSVHWLSAIPQNADPRPFLDCLLLNRLRLGAGSSAFP